MTVRGYAAGLLDSGYPRDQLYADLARARDLLEMRGARGDAEDVPVDVSDFLVGFCAPHMKL